MPEITYSPLFDNNDLPSSRVYDSLYSPGGNSLEVLNGRLDEANLATDFLIDYLSIQDGSVSGGGMTSGTRNIDYFGGTSDKIDGWFDGVGQSELDAGIQNYLPIPGAGVQFYLPFSAFVLLTWQVSWVSDAKTEQSSMIKLFVDGLPEYTHAFSRRCRRTMFRTDPGKEDGSTATVAMGQKFLRDRYKGRYWCGHRLLSTLDAGYHSASLRISADENIKQSRVRARSMKYIYFKRGNSGPG
jgi:hypothetical protein